MFFSYRKPQIAVFPIIMLLFLSAPLMAGNNMTKKDTQAGNTARSGSQQADSGKNPYLKEDDTWISLNGKVVDTKEDAFTLDYGQGNITVEMDDWDWYKENRNIIKGDQVTVYGEVDDDFFEAPRIEASSVYVKGLDSYFYASSDDEEDGFNLWVSYDPMMAGKTILRGTVTDIDDREFTLDTGAQELTIDTGDMAADPMDDSGFQKVEVGDYVSVSGNMDNSFWDTRELRADDIVTIENV